MRRSNLSYRCSKCLDEVCFSDDAYNLVKKCLESLKKELEDMNITCNEGFQGNLVTIPSTINVHPPDHARTKGSGIQIKGEKEKSNRNCCEG